jgi:hypothetical protein
MNLDKIVNFLRWLDIRVFGNGDAYRSMLWRNGFFTVGRWSDTEVLAYLKR